MQGGVQTQPVQPYAFYPRPSSLPLAEVVRWELKPYFPAHYPHPDWDSVERRRLVLRVPSHYAAPQHAKKSPDKV